MGEQIIQGFIGNYKDTGFYFDIRIFWRDLSKSKTLKNSLRNK